MDDVVSDHYIRCLQGHIGQRAQLISALANLPSPVETSIESLHTTGHITECKHTLHETRCKSKRMRWERELGDGFGTARVVICDFSAYPPPRHFPLCNLVSAFPL